VIVENKYPRIGPLLAIEMRRRQPADAAAHHDEVVVFASRFDLTRLEQKLAIAQAMCGFECTGMTATQPGQGWWIISRHILRGRAIGECGRKILRQQLISDNSADSNWNAVKKIPPRNRRFIICHIGSLRAPEHRRYPQRAETPRLSLRAEQVDIAFGAEHVGVQTRNPLPAARRDVEITDRTLNVRRNALPVKLRVQIRNVGR
jgi:hypothetical protein